MPNTVDAKPLQCNKRLPKTKISYNYVECRCRRARTFPLQLTFVLKPPGDGASFEPEVWARVPRSSIQ